MSYLIAAPELMADAALNLANIGSAIGSANVAAAAATTGVLPAAADEVSAAIAALFSQHAAGYQQLSAAAEAFHQQFVRTLTAGAATYVAAEANVVQGLVSAAPTLGVDLSGGLGGLAASLGADAAALGASFNTALTGSFGGSLSGMVPIGTALATDFNGGLSAMAQTGAALPSGFGSGLSGLAGSLTAGLPGLQTGLSGGLSGLNSSLSSALTAGLGGGLSGFAPLAATLMSDLNGGLTALTQTGGTLAGSLSAALPGLSGGLTADIAALANGSGFAPALMGINAGLAGLAAQLNLALTGGLNGALPPLLASLTAPFQLLLPGAPSAAAFLAQLQAIQTGLNSAVLNAELGFNAALTANELALEAAIFGNVGNAMFNSGYNFWNSVLGAGEAIFDSLLGVQVPAGFLPGSLLVGTSPILGGGALGGLLFAVPDALLWGLNVVGQNLYLIVPGGGTLQAIPLGAGLVAAPIAGLQGFGNAELGFFNNLVGAETAFNTNLLTNELAFEASVFGPNAFNGALNRLFNAGNLTLLTGEQTVNSFLGGSQLPALNADLFLTGSSQQVFNGANAVGGIEGVVDQLLAGGADLAGMR